jgi:SpoVK/Ycf46/Vps4 family AAA+-type ATPase
VAYERPAERDEIAERIAAETPGFSGAQLRQLCEQAKRLAVRANGYTRPVAPALADLRAVLESSTSNGSV